jgi:Domain of unknown function (DUF4386)
MTTLDGLRERSRFRASSLERTIGLAGIAGTALFMTTISISAPNEPTLDASTADAAEFVAGLHGGWVAQAEAASDVAMILLLWSLVGLGLLLRRFEGEVPVRSTVAMLSAALFVGWVVLDASQEAGAHRFADLDQGQLAYAYDVTSLGITNVFLAMGSYAIACGWLMISTRAMPRWLGWWGVASGIGLALAHFIWKNEVAFWLLYIPWWLWLVAAFVLLVRSPLGDGHHPKETSTA